MPVVELRGCRPEPLAGYLKALAVFRLVSTQVDSRAKGWWRGEYFCLESSLDAVGLLTFFLNDYSPTPLVAPWNGGSGFYPGDRRDGIDAILMTKDERFSDYRDTIRLVQQFEELPRNEGMKIADMLVVATASSKKEADQQMWQQLAASLAQQDLAKPLAQLSADGFSAYAKKLAKGSPEAAAAKEQAKTIKKLVTRIKKTGAGTKAEIVGACRNRLGDRAVEWLDAAAVLRADSELGYPPILGTGGNEGRLDYTNNFMVRLKDLLINPDGGSAALLRCAILGEASEGLIDASTGQFDPGRAGGFNQGNGVESSTAVNPWDQVLGLEGAAGWVGGVSRRQRVNSPRLAVSPFTVASSNIGYGSAAESDSEGARAEVWMPLWSRPVEFSEFRSLLKEGRAEVGKHLATSGLQFAQAIATLRIDRGIAEFARFAILKRRGDSYVALPAGRVRVAFTEAADLIQELTPIFDDFARLKEPGARLSSAKQVLERAIFDFLVNKHPDRLVFALQAFGCLVRQLDFSHRRLYLTQGWLTFLDTVPEFRIAAALASLHAIDKAASFTYLQRSSPHRAWIGSNLFEKMASVAARRLMEDERAGASNQAFAGSLPLSPEEATPFLLGHHDESQIEDLLFACTQLDWGRIHHPEGWGKGSAQGIISRDWALLKCLFAGDTLYPVRGQPGVTVRTEPTVIPLLLAGRISEACAVAQRRLRASGLHPFRVQFAGGGDGTRLAAGLLIPVTQRQLLAAVLTRSEDDIN